MTRRALLRNPVVQFVALAYGFSWAFWLAGLALYPPGLPAAERAPGTVFSILGTFGPFVAAFLVTARAGTGSRLRARLVHWRVAPRWYLVAVGLPIAVVAVAYALHRVLGGAPFVVHRTPSLRQVVVLFLLTLFVGGGNEEPGWRGVLLPALESRFGALPGTLVLAVVWAGWHLPAFLDPSSVQSALPVGAWLVAVAASAVLLTTLYNRTASIPVVAIFHASFNVTAVLALSALPTASVTRFYWLGAALYLVAAAFVILATDRRLGYTRDDVHPLAPTDH